MSEDEHEPETAQEAFARVEGELALLRRAVERMAVERAEVPEQPDYSETLGGMVQKIDATLQRADALVAAAKEGATPRHVVDRIVAAGADARAEDRRTIATAAAELKDATSAAFAAAVDEADRFKRSRTAGAYFGLVPRRHQSGELDWTGRITKQGDGTVRKLLYEAANSILTRTKQPFALKTWALKIAKRRGLKKARVALARRLAVIMHAMLRDGTLFEA